MVITCVAYGCNNRYAKGSSITFHSFPQDVHMKKVWEIKLRRADFKATKYSRLCSEHFSEDCFDKEKFGGTWLKPDAVPTIFNFPKHMQYLNYIPESTEPTEEMQNSSPLQLVLDAESLDTSFPLAVTELPSWKVLHSSKMLHEEESFNMRWNDACMVKAKASLMEKAAMNNGTCSREDDQSGYLNLSSNSCDLEDMEGSYIPSSDNRRLSYIKDFTEKDMLSPVKAIKLFHLAKRRIEKKDLLVKSMRQRNRRLQKRVSRLKMIIKELKGDSAVWDFTKDLLQPSPTNEMDESSGAATSSEDESELSQGIINSPDLEPPSQNYSEGANQSFLDSIPSEQNINEDELSVLM